MKNMFSGLHRKLKLLISRAVVTAVNDSLKGQNIQVTLLADEVADDVERFQNYGHTSVPPSGSEAIVLSVSGKRQHPVAIVVDNKATRMNNLKSGDSALYHMDGHNLLLTENGEAVLICDKFTVQAQTIVYEAQEIVCDAQQTLITGNLTIVGTSTALDHVSSGVSGNSHIHLGVIPGPGPTGGPV